MSFIPYGTQWIDEDDIAQVVEVLRSDFLTQGPAVSAFEQSLSAYTGAKYCVAVANATAALHIAVKALDIPAGMEGITSPNTFVASANCLVYNGLKPVFADIEADSFNIDPMAVGNKITPTTKVIVPVHFAGRPCNMEKIHQMSKQQQIFIIEDAAHAIGSCYEDGSRVGNCQYSDMTVFSFHPVKTITTGEGGAITTNSKDLYEKLLRLRSHGITKDPSMLIENPGPWYYEMHDLGYNFRMTDIAAVLGTSQLQKLDSYKQRRKEIIAKYNSGLEGIPTLHTPMSDKADACFHLYVVQIDFEQLAKTRAEVMEQLKTMDVGTQVHYIPVHMQPYYKKSYGYNSGDYPVAEYYYEQALSLPLYPKMTDADVDQVIASVREVLS